MESATTAEELAFRHARNAFVAMREITLKHGYVVLVDDDDFDRVSQYTWGVSPRAGRRDLYATSHVNKKTVSLHRFILNCTVGDGVVVDHINGNTLDNRKSNLRKCSAAENSRHIAKCRYPKSSVYKGVSIDKNAKGWRAQIKFERKQYYIGVFRSEREAAEAYNKEAIRLHGEFAGLNILD